jgi:hypothetical protein
VRAGWLRGLWSGPRFPNGSLTPSTAPNAPPQCPAFLSHCDDGCDRTMGHRPATHCYGSAIATEGTRCGAAAGRLTRCASPDGACSIPNRTPTIRFRCWQPGLPSIGPGAWPAALYSLLLPSVFWRAEPPSSVLPRTSSPCSNLKRRWKMVMSLYSYSGLWHALDPRPDPPVGVDFSWKRCGVGCGNCQRNKQRQHVVRARARGRGGFRALGWRGPVTVTEEGGPPGSAGVDARPCRGFSLYGACNSLPPQPPPTAVSVTSSPVNSNNAFKSVGICTEHV